MAGEDSGAGAGEALAPAWPGLVGEDAEGPFIRGGCCTACGFVALSAHAICPRCWTKDSMGQQPIGRTGRLYSSTVIHALPPGFEQPYAVGYVDVEQGVRVFAHLEGGPAQPAIGEEVELTLVPLKQDASGTWLSGPRYRRRSVGKEAQ